MGGHDGAPRRYKQSRSNRLRIRSVFYSIIWEMGWPWTQRRCVSCSLGANRSGVIQAGMVTLANADPPWISFTRWSEKAKSGLVPVREIPPSRQPLGQEQQTSVAQVSW
jgi:hypothetical protein